LAGLLLEIKGDFPTLKENLKRGPFNFQVMQVERHRITKVKVTVDNTPKETTEQPDNQN